ncbi:hypothetical protein NDU88_003809 [Pleurodeles waltl]|uniref:Uncharacterized protein n=1 Tax=Pleurodeles waltl TaxID=8319 RepID=A0AAV7RH98_PLEWA|nr:hypothetical protein NDU88_003809 [Pleurodeles waltl]
MCNLDHHYEDKVRRFQSLKLLSISGLGASRCQAFRAKSQSLGLFPFSSDHSEGVKVSSADTNRAGEAVKEASKAAPAGSLGTGEAPGPLLHHRSRPPGVAAFPPYAGRKFSAHSFCLTDLKDLRICGTALE